MYGSTYFGEGYYGVESRGRIGEAKTLSIVIIAQQANINSSSVVLYPIPEKISNPLYTTGKQIATTHTQSEPESLVITYPILETITNPVYTSGKQIAIVSGQSTIGASSDVVYPAEKKTSATLSAIKLNPTAIATIPESRILLSTEKQDASAVVNKQRTAVGLSSISSNLISSELIGQNDAAVSTATNLSIAFPQIATSIALAVVGSGEQQVKRAEAEKYH